MFNFIKNLFSSKSKILDKGLEMIDKGNFTEQEKALKKIEIYKEQMTLGAVAKRGIAYVITGVYSLCFLVGFVISTFNETKAKTLLKFLNESFMLVISFYFGKVLIENFKKK